LPVIGEYHWGLILKRGKFWYFYYIRGILLGADQDSQACKDFKGTSPQAEKEFKVLKKGGIWKLFIVLPGFPAYIH